MGKILGGVPLSRIRHVGHSRGVDGETELFGLRAFLAFARFKICDRFIDMSFCWLGSPTSRASTGRYLNAPRVGRFPPYSI